MRLSIQSELFKRLRRPTSHSLKGVKHVEAQSNTTKLLLAACSAAVCTTISFTGSVECPSSRKLGRVVSRPCQNISVWWSSRTCIIRGASVSRCGFTPPAGWALRKTATRERSTGSSLGARVRGSRKRTEEARGPPLGTAEPQGFS
jgi:hypothetical protein